MKIRLILSISIFCLFFSCTRKNKTAKENSNEQVVETLPDVEAVVGLGRIEPRERLMPLATQTGGVIAKVHKKENDSVHEGDIIIELEHGIEDSRIDQIRNKLATQKLQIVSDAAAVEETKANFSNKEIELARLKQLLSKGAETQQTVDNLSAEVKVLSALLFKLTSQVAVSRSKLLEIQSDLNTAIQELALKIIKAPLDGKVMTMDALKGSAVQPQQSFAQLIPAGDIVALCEIDELFANNIKIGQKAVIRPVGSNQTLGSGIVVFASSALKKKSLFSEKAGDQEDRRVREIKILLDTPGKYLINSRIECVIDVR